MKIILIIAVFIDNIYHNGYVANIKIKNNNYNINPNMCNVKKCNVCKLNVDIKDYIPINCTIPVGCPFNQKLNK
tara:strand:+ start:109 stop:330 length:222 start_codon:yes stop_codon:yes gene_type:complete